MASAAFRDSMGALGWARRQPDVPVNTSPPTIAARLQALNPFASTGHVRLPTSEGPGAPLPAPTRREEEEGWFALSRWDRLMVFGALVLSALALFAVSIFFIMSGVAILKPRKFAILWSMGSLLFIVAFGVLMGFRAYAQHVLSGPRLGFSAAYFGSIALTLWFSVGLHQTILTLVAAAVQLVALIWYLVSYFPMGSTGLRFAARLGSHRVAAWMSDS